MNKRAGRTEAEIQKATVQYLKASGYQVWSTSQNRASSVTKGMADLFVTGRGVCCWVEMKASWGKQSPEQKDFQRAVEENGGLYHLGTHESEVLAFLLEEIT